MGRRRQTPKESRTERIRVMLEKGRMQKLGLALVAAGALSLATSTGAEARLLGLLLGGGLPHLGGFGGLHHFGVFGGGFRPAGFGGAFHGGPLGFRQAGLGYPGFRSAGGSRWHNGSSQGRYLGAYGAALAVGAYSNAYPTTGSDNNGYPAYGYYGYPAYGY